MCPIKKIKTVNDRSVERSSPNTGCFHRWNVNYTVRTSKQMPHMIFGYVAKEESETTIKKIFRKNGSKFICEQMVFQERKCQMHSPGKWGWCEWINFCFRSFFSFLYLEGYVLLFHKTSCNSRSIWCTDLSTRPYWKSNALQNTCALLEFC